MPDRAAATCQDLIIDYITTQGHASFEQGTTPVQMLKKLDNYVQHRLNQGDSRAKDVYDTFRAAALVSLRDHDIHPYMRLSGVAGQGSLADTELDNFTRSVTMTEREHATKARRAFDNLYGPEASDLTAPNFISQAYQVMVTSSDTRCRQECYKRSEEEASRCPDCRNLVESAGLLQRWGG
jgi:hypothetical protein